MKPIFVQRSVVGTVLLLVIGGGIFLYALRPVSAEESIRTILIKPGDGIREIAIMLKNEGVIRFAWAMKLWSVISLGAHALKPGRYEVDSARTTPDIVAMLRNGNAAMQTVLIPEGQTLREIEGRLTGLHILEPGELSGFSWEHLKADYPFLADATTLEGFLFPDTYRFSFYESPEFVARTFLDTFKEKAWPMLAASDDPYRTLILASMLEKEVKAQEEQRLVAGITLKRLRANMPLQIDATVLYARCAHSAPGEKCGRLSKADFEIDSPYNTYRVKGLPPAPIGNPGRQSLRAAQEPKSSPYWFYLTDPATGRAIFGETLEEHTANRARYLHL